MNDDLVLLIETSRALPDAHRIAVAADVVNAVLVNAKEGGGFRTLLYQRLGFDAGAYFPLYIAGGMEVSNNFVLFDTENTLPDVINRLGQLAMEAPMEPDPTLTRVDGSVISFPSQLRNDLHYAYQCALDLIATNRTLTEANRRLMAQLEIAQDELEQHKKTN